MTHEESIKTIVKLPKDHRQGEVWKESWGENGLNALFLVLGVDDDSDGIYQFYKLLNLESGMLDGCSLRLLDLPDIDWKRIE